MRKILPNQLLELQNHLIRKPFQYEEVFFEILDHYASTYEETNLSLDEVIRSQDQEFTAGKVENLNNKYLSDLKRQVLKAHGKIWISFFKWPQIINTLAFMVLFILAGPYLIKYLNVTIWLLFAAAFFPIVLNVWSWIRWKFRKKSYPGSLKNAHVRLTGMTSWLSITLLNLLNVFKLFSDEPTLQLFKYHYLSTALIFILMIGTTIVSVRLFKMKFRPHLV